MFISLYNDLMFCLNILEHICFGMHRCAFSWAYTQSGISGSQSIHM